MKSALIVVDVQQSFPERPYWSDTDAPRFLERLQALIDRCTAQNVPVLQVFHVEEDEGPENPFSRRSGYVKTLAGLRIEPAEVFSKSVHSAMFAATADGQSMDYWLRKRGIGHLIVSGIRTEQCCETTTRHASDMRSEEHTSELQSPCNLVCRLLLEKKRRSLRRPRNAQRGTFGRA